MPAAILRGADERELLVCRLDDDDEAVDSFMRPRNVRFGPSSSAVADRMKRFRSDANLASTTDSGVEAPRDVGRRRARRRRRRDGRRRRCATGATGGGDRRRAGLDPSRRLDDRRLALDIHPGCRRPAKARPSRSKRRPHGHRRTPWPRGTGATERRHRPPRYWRATHARRRSPFPQMVFPVRGPAAPATAGEDAHTDAGRRCPARRVVVGTGVGRAVRAAVSWSWRRGRAAAAASACPESTFTGRLNVNRRHLFRHHTLTRAACNFAGPSCLTPPPKFLTSRAAFGRGSAGRSTFDAAARSFGGRDGQRRRGQVTSCFSWSFVTPRAARHRFQAEERNLREKSTSEFGILRDIAGLGPPRHRAEVVGTTSRRWRGARI